MAPTIQPREALIGKALMDEAFAKELIADPNEAVKKAGIKLSAADLKKLQALTPQQRTVLVSQARGAVRSAAGTQAYYDNLKVF